MTGRAAQAVATAAPRGRRWLGWGLGLAILAVLVWRLGAGPFVEGIRAVDASALALGALIGVLTTVCCAWRWRLVARGLGIALPLGAAVASYYRSQFLNTVLPGGVIGDVHRGYRHGRDAGDVGRGLRAVGWERAAGQVVLGVLAAVVLLVAPSPLRSSMLAVGACVVVVVAAAVAVGLRLPGAGRWGRIRSTAVADIRHGLLARHAWPGIVVTSVLVVAGHAVTFIVAARTAGSEAPVGTLLPLAVIALLAMAVPTSIAGWGPREGAAAWTFAVTGLGAAEGVATAVVYGVMVIVACSPGAAVLLVSWVRRVARPPGRTAPEVSPAAPPVRDPVGPVGAVDG